MITTPRQPNTPPYWYPCTRNDSLNRQRGKPNDNELNTMPASPEDGTTAKKVDKMRRRKAEMMKKTSCASWKNRLRRKSWPVFWSSIFSCPPINLLHPCKAETTPTTTNGCPTTTNLTGRASVVYRPPGLAQQRHFGCNDGEYNTTREEEYYSTQHNGGEWGRVQPSPTRWRRGWAQPNPTWWGGRRVGPNPTRQRGGRRVRTNPAWRGGR